MYVCQWKIYADAEAEADDSEPTSSVQSRHVAVLPRVTASESSCWLMIYRIHARVPSLDDGAIQMPPTQVQV